MAKYSKVSHPISIAMKWVEYEIRKQKTENEGGSQKQSVKKAFRTCDKDNAKASN